MASISQSLIYVETWKLDPTVKPWGNGLVETFPIKSAVSFGCRRGDYLLLFAAAASDTTKQAMFFFFNASQALLASFSVSEVMRAR